MFISNSLSRWLVDAARYGWASFIALAIDMAVLSFSHHYLNLYVWQSATLGFCAGMLAVYTLSIRWVFSHRRIEETHYEVLIFIAIGLVALLINNIVLLYLHHQLGWQPEAAKLPAAAITFLFNFVVRRCILFAPV